MFWRGVERAAAVALMGFVLATAGDVARAEEPARPWAEGVSETAQERATRLFEKGSALLDEGLYGPALDVLREALVSWNHPAIQYNAAVALISLDRPIEAYEELTGALRFGAAPLEASVYEQALRHKARLEKRIVRLTVECTEPGAEVSLDSRTRFSCPVLRTELLEPGEHLVVTAKEGYLTRTTRLILVGGESKTLRLDLMRVEDSLRESRRWAVWKPWAVVGAGAALGLSGALFHSSSRAKLTSYDNAVAELCAMNPCSELPGIVTDAYDTAQLHNTVAIGLYAAGGAAAATGLVLAYLNRGHVERIGYDAPLQLAPSVGGRGATVTAKVRF